MGSSVPHLLVMVTFRGLLRDHDRNDTIADKGVAGESTRITRRSQNFGTDNMMSRQMGHSEAMAYGNIEHDVTH
jgi:hypothetical protein